MLKASSPSGGNVSVAAKALHLLLRRLAADLRERSRALDESRQGGCWPQGAPRVSGASGGNPAGRIRADGGKRAKHQRGAAIRATDLSGVNGTRASRRARRMRENIPHLAKRLKTLEKPPLVHTSTRRCGYRTKVSFCLRTLCPNWRAGSDRRLPRGMGHRPVIAVLFRA